MGIVNQFSRRSILSSMIGAATQIAVSLERPSSAIIIENSSNNDDAVLACLVQICLDPHYRTYDGFCGLIHKEWIENTYKTKLFPKTHPTLASIGHTQQGTN